MLTGVIFGAIVIAWIVYLVPYFLSRREDDSQIDQRTIDQFADSMHVVRRSGEITPGFLVDSGAPVSTPLTRRAARHHLRQATRTAVRRRRRGLLVHLVLAVLGVVAPFVLPISHWWTVLPVGLLVGWLILSRISVVTLDRMLRADRAEVAFGDEEPTVVIQVTNHEETVVLGETERSIELTGPSPGHARLAVGPHSGHPDDVCVAAAAATFGAHHRPVRAGRLERVGRAGDCSASAAGRAARVAQHAARGGGVVGQRFWG